MEDRYRSLRQEMLGTLRKLLRQEAVPLEREPVLRGPRGLVDERDKKIRAQAIVAMMQHILRDPEVKVLLENMLHVWRLGHVERVFEEDRDHRFAQLLGEGIWKEYDAKRRQMEQAIVRQVDAAQVRLIVLRLLAEKMKALGVLRGVRAS